MSLEERYSYAIPLVNFKNEKQEVSIKSKKINNKILQDEEKTDEIYNKRKSVNSILKEKQNDEFDDDDLDLEDVALDKKITKSNDIEDEFDENDSEIETVARDSIGVTVEKILEYFGIDIDIEEAIRERDW